jgi:hypothetical protein
MHRLVLILALSIVGFGLSGTSVDAQGLPGKKRADAAAVLEGIASAEDGGLRSGSCLRPIGEVGTEEFSVYLLLPVSKIEGFVVEFSGDDGTDNEIVANAGIVSFAEDGDAVIRQNMGLEWVAEAYRLAANFIRANEMYQDDSYADALSRLPTERCPLPYGWN